MSDDGPERLDLNIVLAPQSTIPETVAVLHEHVLHQVGFVPQSWTPIADSIAAGSFDAARRKGWPEPDALRTVDAEHLGRGLLIEGAGWDLSLFAIGRARPRRSDVTYGAESGVRLFVTERGFAGHGPDAYFDTLRRQIALLRLCLDRLEVAGAHIERDDDVLVGPDPPLATCTWLAAVVETERVGRDYPTPDLYWRGWDQVEYRGGGRALVLRGADLFSRAAFLAHAAESGYAIARGAERGLTDYFAPDLDELQEPVLGRHARYLHQVGYSPKHKVLEFAAELPEGGEFTPADLVELIDYRDGAAGEDAPIETIRVMFPDRAMAEREARLLWDIGAQVRFYGDDGRVETLRPA